MKNLSFLLLWKQRSPGYISVQRKHHADTDGNAEKAYDGIEHSDRAGNVITVDHVADSVGEGNSGNHEDNAADDHGIKIFSGAEAVTEDAKKGDPGTAENGAHDPSQMRIAEIHGIGLIQASDNNGT